MMSLFDILFKLSRKNHVMNNLLRFLFGCDIPEKTKIGRNVVFNHKAMGCVIHPNAVIEDNVYFEHHVCLGQRTGTDASAPIIRENCVIGAYAMILGGIEIGANSVIGAGSLVMESVPPNSIFYNTREKYIKENDKPVRSY